MTTPRRACEELGRGDSSVRGIVSEPLGLVAKTVAAYGTDEQKQHWLPRLTSGEALGCLALTEPDSGSDAGSLRTSARRDGAVLFLASDLSSYMTGTVLDVTGGRHI